MKLRVAELSAHLTRAGGGIFTSVCQLSHALAAQPGVEVEIFGPEPAGALGAEWGKLPMQVFPQMGPASFGFAPGLAKGLASAAPDVLHVHGLWMHPSKAAAAFTPRVVSPHGMLDPWALKNSAWKKRLAAWAFEDANLHGAACLHALCAPEAQAMRAYGLKNPVCVIPNGVDVPEQTAASSHPNHRTLLYLGRLHPKKGLPDLLRAWKEAHREPWRLVVAGWDEGGHEAALRKLAASLGLAESVSFPGSLFEEAKRAAFQECDGFILPSLSEGLPMVLLEAWAWGKPVLMTPQCNLPAGFAAGAALRIEPGVEAIAQGLADFFAMDDARRQAMGARGLQLVRERFSWPAIAAEMTRVYEWVCGRGPRPASVITP